MRIGDDECAQAVARIAHDLMVTLGWDQRRATALAEPVAEDICGWWQRDAGSFAVKVAGDVQQQLHDTLIDTTWPTCPLHPRHPLWLDDQRDRPVWRCTTAGVDVASLGALPGDSRS